MLLLGVPPLLRVIAYVPVAPVNQLEVVEDEKSKLNDVCGGGGGDASVGADVGAGVGATVGPGTVTVNVSVFERPLAIVALSRNVVPDAATERVPPFQPSPNESAICRVCAPGARHTEVVYTWLLV